MKTLVTLLLAAVLFAGCATTRVVDPVTKLELERRTFLMKEGAKDITFSDGERTVTINTGENDQTEVGNKLIEFGQSLK